MSTIETVFVTKLYRAELQGAENRRLITGVEGACRSLAADDAAGRRWCAEHDYPGYTSYASLDDLPHRFPEFADLEGVLDAHVAAFARELDFDLSGTPLVLDSLWANLIGEGGFHAAHIHPRSVVSGTFYVSVPKGSAVLKFEDPRLSLMMASPPRKPKARIENQSFHSVAPKTGTLLLWESWLRHEVPLNRSRGERISVSFNYRW
ncbi:MAG: TIGR02466 family protein [Hyphomicrobium sp.]